MTAQTQMNIGYLLSCSISAEAFSTHILGDLGIRRKVALVDEENTKWEHALLL
jgi:hypothetical protein